MTRRPNAGAAFGLYVASAQACEKPHACRNHFQISDKVAFFPYISIPVRNSFADNLTTIHVLTNMMTHAVTISHVGTVEKPVRKIVMIGLVTGKNVAIRAIVRSGLLMTGPSTKKDRAGNMNIIPWLCDALCKSSMVAPIPTQRAAKNRYPSKTNSVNRGSSDGVINLPNGMSSKKYAIGKPMASQKQI